MFWSPRFLVVGSVSVKGGRVGPSETEGMVSLICLDVAVRKMPDVPVGEIAGDER